METWEYMKSTDMPKGKSYLVRQKGGKIEDWTSQRKTWQKNNNAIGAFIGFEDHYEKISVEEVNSIIAQYK